MDADLRDAERLYQAEETDENRVRLRRAQERAQVIVWVACSQDLSNHHDSPNFVWGVFSSEEKALEEMMKPNPRGSHPYRKLPETRNGPKQPRPGDGVYLFNGWMQNGIRIFPVKIDERR